MQKTREDEGNETRKIWFQAGIHSDFSRVRDRLGQCMEISVYYRRVWWSGICADLFVFPAGAWFADHGYGVFSGKSKSVKYCAFF